MAKKNSLQPDGVEPECAAETIGIIPLRVDKVEIAGVGVEASAKLLTSFPNRRYGRESPPSAVVPSDSPPPVS